MSDIILVPQLGNVGASPCYQNEQERYVDFMSKTVWTLPLGELSGVWISDALPPDNSYIWFKIDPTTKGMVRPTPFLYSTTFGQWIALHPTPAVDNERMIWVGTPAQLWAYDGGDGTDPGVSVPTPTTGAMWEVDTGFADMVAGGVGPTILAVATDYDVNEAQTAAPNTVQVRGVYYAKRTARLFYQP